MAGLRVLALLLLAVLTHQVYAYTTTFCNPAAPPYGNGYFSHLTSATNSRATISVNGQYCTTSHAYFHTYQVAMYERPHTSTVAYPSGNGYTLIGTTAAPVNTFNIGSGTQGRRMDISFVTSMEDLDCRFWQLNVKNTGNPFECGYSSSCCFPARGTHGANGRHLHFQASDVLFHVNNDNVVPIDRPASMGLTYNTGSRVFTQTINEEVYAGAEYYTCQLHDGSSWKTHARFDGIASTSFNRYFVTGTEILVTFSSATAMGSVNTKAGVDAVLSFTRGIGSDYTGTWECDTKLRVTVTSGYTPLQHTHPSGGLTISNAGGYPSISSSVVYRSSAYLRRHDPSSLHSEIGTTLGDDNWPACEECSLNFGYPRNGDSVNVRCASCNYNAGCSSTYRSATAVGVGNPNAGPSVSASTINMNTRELTLTFTEEVFPQNRFTPTTITIGSQANGGGPLHTLATVTSTACQGTTLSMYFSAADLEDLQRAYPTGINTGSTYLAIGTFPG